MSETRDTRRPLSQYDNLSSSTTTCSPTTSTAGYNEPTLHGSGDRDIRFQFDDVSSSSSPPAPTKSVISDAKSIFFGLKPVVAQYNHNHVASGSGGGQITTAEKQKSEENLPLMYEQEIAKATTPVANKYNYNNHNHHESTKSQHSMDSKESNGNGKKITLLVDDDVREDASSCYLGSPSQAVYMSTTVPQNISKTSISGRHKPTRTSLRHSRMLVMNKIQNNRNQYALEIDCRLLARICYGTMLFSAIIICIICLGILLWAPNTPAKDNPYWSGIMLFLCGIITLAVTEFKKLPQNRLKENYFTFLQINCAILLIVTIFCCSLALIYNIIHLATLTNPEKECLPENLAFASKSCVCLYGDSRNQTRSELQPAIEIGDGQVSNGEIRNVIKTDTTWGFEVHYKDFTCDEVLGTWHDVILTLLVLNLVALIGSIVFSVIFIIGSKNRTRRNYTSVRMMQQTQQP